MIIRIHFTVHVYAENRLCDDVLKLNSENYGIIGADIIAPLRRINGNTIEIDNIPDSFNAGELWDYIDTYLYKKKDEEESSTYDFVKEYNITEKYLVYDNIRYDVVNTDTPLLAYQRARGLNESDIVNVQILICSDAGQAMEEDGISYEIRSKEKNHNEPHVHAKVGDYEYPVSIKTGELIETSHGTEKKLSGKRKKQIRELILKKQKELLELWNNQTDGLKVDIDQVLGVKGY